MRTFTTVELLREFPNVTQAAARGPVAITRHRRPRYVLMAIEDYQQLAGQGDPRRVFTVDNLPDDVKGELGAGLEALIAELEPDAD